MPSKHQVAGKKRYEPSKLAERFGEDPARFMACGPELALARIRGVRDADFPEGVTAAEYLKACKAVARKHGAPARVKNAIRSRLNEIASKGDPE